MARARSSVRFGRGPKRQSTWIGPADQGAVGVATTGATIVSSFDPEAAALPRPTIVRSRGIIHITPQTFGADLTIHGAFGMAIVSDQAFAAGIASIPKPFDEANWDGWFLHQYFSCSAILASAVGLQTPAGASYLLDSKSGRKLQDNESVVVMITNASATDGMRFTLDFRMLFKLP